MLKSVVVVATLAFAVSAPAQAQVPSPGTPAAPPAAGAPPPPLPPAQIENPYRRRGFSLTISPLHLFSPVLELTGEIRVGDKLGLAVVAGAGTYSDTSDFGVEVSATALEAGAQFRYYVLGDFQHGMQLGAELLYLHLSDSNLSASGQGVAIGPFVGYKYVADVGFTFDTQLGFQRVSAEGSSGGGTTSSGSDVIVLLNINIGWSF